MLHLFFILIFYVLSLSAHQTGLSYLELNENSKHTIAVVYKKPLSDTKGKDIRFHFSNKCVQVNSPVTMFRDGYKIDKYSLWCGTNGLMESRVWVEGLNSIDRGVMLHYERKEALFSVLLRSQTPLVYFQKKNSQSTIFLDYIKLGFFHILTGYDHLLFLFALLLLAKTYKKLILAITAFTISHSITLISSLFGVVSLNINYIETMIALSILLLARELLSKKKSYTKEHLEFVTFIFGLLHGFGFSNALSNIGLVHDEIVISLLSFNIGIELGQLLFVFIISIILFFLKRFNMVLEKILYNLIPYLIGIISSYWFIERMLNLSET